jgi:hypothetical protein
MFVYLRQQMTHIKHGIYLPSVAEGKETTRIHPKIFMGDVAEILQGTCPISFKGTSFGTALPNCGPKSFCGA